MTTGESGVALGTVPATSTGAAGVPTGTGIAGSGSAVDSTGVGAAERRSVVDGRVAGREALVAVDGADTETGTVVLVVEVVVAVDVEGATVVGGPAAGEIGRAHV